MKMMKSTGGFTLVELIVVIAILAILAAVAVPAYSGYIKEANDAAVQSELTAISTAAMAAEAVSGQLTGITVSADGKTVTFTGVDAKDFAKDFKTYYGTDNAPVVDAADSTKYVATITASTAWTGSNYAVKGATWSPSAGWKPVE